MQTQFSSIVLLPILFARIFNQPLGFVDWWMWLNKSISPRVFFRQVCELVELGLVEVVEDSSEKNRYFCSEKLFKILPKNYHLLFGQQLNRVVEKRNRKFNNNSQRKIVFQKIKEAEPLFVLCGFLPWVRGVAITGSIAAFDPKSANDDLDFFVVCANNRLWLTRPILVLFSQLFGKRRTWKGEEPNSWCFNMWVEEHSLSLPTLEKNYYTAREVFQAWWLVDKSSINQVFLQYQSWVKGWFEFQYKQKILESYQVTEKNGNSSDRFGKSTEFSSTATSEVFNQLSLSSFNNILIEESRIFPIGLILDWLNSFMFKIQLLYMKNHYAGGFVSKTMALFHR